MRLGLGSEIRERGGCLLLWRGGFARCGLDGGGRGEAAIEVVDWRKGWRKKGLEIWVCEMRVDGRRLNRDRHYDMTARCCILEGYFDDYSLEV